MPRHMSFFMTQQAIIQRTKFVTRRFSWWNAKVGWEVQPVVKCQGLKKGEHIQKLGNLIEFVSLRTEPLEYIDYQDVLKEGFTGMSVESFILMLMKHYKCSRTEPVNRIEFKYL